MLRQGHNSPSSSMEVTSLPRGFHGSNEEGEGRGGSSSCSEEEPAEPPILRYRIPCPQVNLTLVILIAMEPGIPSGGNEEALPATGSQRHGLEPSPERLRASRENSPLVCSPVQMGTSRLAPGRDKACPSALAGPSERAGPSGSVPDKLAGVIIPISDSDDSLCFGC